MKSLIIVGAALFLIIATPFVFDAIRGAQTDEYAQSIAGVTTGAGVYAANVTLSQEAFNDNVNSITSISSNISGSDSPTASVYNSVSQALEVTGLEESSTRTLSVTYRVDDTDLPDFMGAFFTLLRWFWVFVPIGFAAGAIYAFFD